VRNELVEGRQVCLLHSQWQSQEIGFLCGFASGPSRVENLNANSTMLEIVMAAFKRAGERCVPFHRAYPLLEQIFKELDRQKPPGDLKTQVRQTVYLYCPDSPKYLDQGAFFTKCRHGAYQVHRPTRTDLT
jgi:hypothetical protein